MDSKPSPLEQLFLSEASNRSLFAALEKAMSSKLGRDRDINFVPDRITKDLAPRARFELATLRLTALSPTQSQFTRAETNRGESASSDQMGLTQIHLLFSVFTVIYRLSSPFAWHLHDTAYQKASWLSRSLKNAHLMHAHL